MWGKMVSLLLLTQSCSTAADKTRKTEHVTLAFGGGEGGFADETTIADLQTQSRNQPQIGSTHALLQNDGPDRERVDRSPIGCMQV